MKLIDHRIEQILEGQQIDLSRMQFVILTKIEQNEGLSQIELACFVQRNKSSLTRMINTLHRKGYIYRETSESDKRMKHIHLSDKGKMIVDKATPHFRNLAQLIEHDLSSKEIGQTIEVLKKIQKNVGEETSSFFE
jgi:DNA-binding MarR family transcriptional regulator